MFVKTLLNFIIKNILSIPTIDLLITFLSISPELRKFCGFLRIPNKSQFSRFKLNFLDDLNNLFNNLVEHTEEISKKIAKDNPNSQFDTKKYAQSQMPKYADSNPDAKLAYLNGHFGYFLKCTISTNAIGLVRNINFYDVDNNLSLDLTPQEIKDKYDAKSLIPSLETFF